MRYGECQRQISKKTEFFVCCKAVHFTIEEGMIPFLQA